MKQVQQIQMKLLKLTLIQLKARHQRLNTEKATCVLKKTLRSNAMLTHTIPMTTYPLRRNRRKLNDNKIAPNNKVDSILIQKS